VPHVDHGAGDRLAVHVAHMAFHEQHLALLGAVIQPCLALRQRRVGDPQRAFDGTRPALRAAGIMPRLAAPFRSFPR
jgi:hypothetical protein